MKLDSEDIRDVVGSAGVVGKFTGDKFRLPLLLLGGAVFLLGSGFAISKRTQSPRLFEDKSDSDSVTFEIKEDGESSENKEESASVYVDVGGAVVNPGVYKLFTGARIKDALVAAGGLAYDADREYISKNLNLAMMISDGGKVYVPGIEDRGLGWETSKDVGYGNVLGKYNMEEMININSASKAQLESLKGIGEIRAEEIIAGRPYRKIEDLVERGVLGEGTFENIKDRVAVY